MTDPLRRIPRSRPSPPRASADADHDAAVRVMDSLRRVVRALGASARGPSAPGGPSGAQLFVLRQIAAAPAQSYAELGARTLAGQSALSEVVGRLIDRGLVARRVSATDARQAELTITAGGRRAIARMEPTAQERLADALASLPRARRLALARGMEAWIEAAGFGDTPAGMFFEEQPEARNARAATRRGPPHADDAAPPVRGAGRLTP